MTRLRLRATAIGAACCVAAACAGRTPAPTLPAPTREFPLVLAEAQLAASSGRYADAERVLSAFARSYDGSREAAEATYWRALFRLDPANRDASSREAIALIDAYLKLPQGTAHRSDAATLRRIAAQREAMARELDLVRAEAARLAAVPVPVAPPRDTVELQRLRDSLSRTNAELDRIRRRIGAPRP